MSLRQAKEARRECIIPGGPVRRYGWTGIYRGGGRSRRRRI